LQFLKGHFMLHLKNITIAYNDTVIVEALTIQIRDSEIVSIIGPNGAGKSTVT
jgi:ABC-type cobalamin/Fe3+-siderophores transport system ATPase subunit